jgi:hypothetical protein
MRHLLGHVSTPGNYRKMRTVRYIDLKFDMGIVIEMLEDIMHDFLPGIVHK